MATAALYDRIGGAKAVDAAVDVFYRKVLADKSISHFFQGVDMDAQRTKQKAFLTMVFGGPKNYSGKDLRTAHKSLVTKGLNETHFTRVATHLQATLQELGVAADIIKEVIGIAASTQKDVLNR